MHSTHHSPVPDRSALILRLPDEVATAAVGGQLAPLLSPGMVVWLEGDLGAGKTTLVRALLRGLGYVGPVKSPTYSLVEVYVVSSLYWYHFDFYRFSEPSEFDDAGLGEYFREDSVCLVEWPEKAAGHAPPPGLVLAFRFAEGSGRIVELEARSEAGRKCLDSFKEQQRGGEN